MSNDTDIEWQNEKGDKKIILRPIVHKKGKVTYEVVYDTSDVGFVVGSELPLDMVTKILNLKAQPHKHWNNSTTKEPLAPTPVSTDGSSQKKNEKNRQ